jgi:hypothetical protein
MGHDANGRSSPVESAQIFQGPRVGKGAAPDRRTIDRGSQPHPFYQASISGSADLEETGITLIAPARPAAALRPATQLFIADHRQYWPQPLVVGDGTLINLANLVEGAVGELDAPVADRKPASG